MCANSIYINWKICVWTDALCSTVQDFCFSICNDTMYICVCVFVKYYSIFVCMYVYVGRIFHAKSMWQMQYFIIFSMHSNLCDGIYYYTIAIAIANNIRIYYALLI